MTKPPSSDMFLKNLKNRLDDNFRPQDDFFAYVNNKWLEKNPIPATESRWGTFYVLRDEAWKNVNRICKKLQKADTKPGSLEQKVRDFYWTGIHKDELKDQHLRELKQELAKVDAIKNLKDLFKHLGYMHRHDLDAGWNLVVDSDDKDSTTYVLRIVQDGLTLPEREYYLDNSDKMKKIRQQFKKHIGRMTLLVPEVDKDGDLQKLVLQFETNLAAHSMNSVELRDIDRAYNPTTADELKQNFPNILWEDYFTSLEWHPKDKVIINQVDFLKYIDSISTDANLPEWKKYLKWRTLVELTGTVSEEFSKAHFKFFGRVLSGRKKIQPLWRRIVTTMDACIGFGVGQIYAREFFPEHSKHVVEGIVEDVRDAFADRIKNLTWMEESTKKYALKKLKNMVVLIGYSEDDRDYSSAIITKHSYLQNYLETNRFESAYHLNKVGTRPRRDDLLMTPQTVNAYHDPNQLVIAFPAGILQPPFFDVHAPDAFNFAGIGAVVGHELTHGFDDQGCQFDAEGNVRNWRSKKDKKAFDAEAAKLSKLADKFEVIPGVFMKGGLVLGESIADLGGLEISLAAYKKKHSNANDEDLKVFYESFAVCECHATTDELNQQLALADPHPNERFRVNGIVQHSDDFYKLYSVTDKDTLFLAPAERVKIW